MEIKIDTKRDSPEDIRRAISLLQQFIINPHVARSNNLFDRPGPSLTPVTPTPVAPMSYPSTPAPVMNEPEQNLNPLNMFNEQPPSTPTEDDSDIQIIEY